MESDSENEHVSETRSRNSSVSSTDEVRSPERDEFTVEQQANTESLRRRPVGDRKPSSKRRHSRDSDGGQPPGTIHYYGVTLSMAACQGGNLTPDF
jgi:hypothetical protein